MAEHVASTEIRDNFFPRLSTPFVTRRMTSIDDVARGGDFAFLGDVVGKGDFAGEGEFACKGDVSRDGVAVLPVTAMPPE